MEAFFSLLVEIIEETFLENPEMQRKHGATIEKLKATYKANPSIMESLPIEAFMTAMQVSDDESTEDQDHSPATSSSSSSQNPDSFQVIAGGKRKRKKGKAPSKSTKAKKPVVASSTESTLTSPCPSPLPPTLVAQPAPVPTTNDNVITNASPRTSRSPSPAPAPATISNTKSPPPIFLHDKDKWTIVSRICDDLKIKFTSAKSCQNGIKIQVPNSGDYRELTSLLKGRNYSFHTYSLPEDTPTRVVIRRVPKEIPVEDIRADLLAQKVPVIAVHRLHKARSGQQYDMVLVVCSRTEGRNPIFNIKSLCSLSGISIEKPYRPTLVGQCHRCQQYGHSQNNCFATPRCVKCQGDHGTQDCPRPKDRSKCVDPPSCVLCGQVGHTANYRGCPRAPKLPPKLAKRFDARQQREAPSTSLPSHKIPQRLAPQRNSPWGKLNHQRGAPQTNPQDIPALMDIIVPVPTPINDPAASAVPTVPSYAQSCKVAPTTTAATASPSQVAPTSHNPRRSVADIIIGAYSIWMTDEARSLAAEISAMEAAGEDNPMTYRALFNKYPSITNELDSLVYRNGQWERN